MGIATCATPSARQRSAQCALGGVASTTWWPRAASPPARSRSWIAAPVKKSAFG
jgi:hypothetical protein